MSTKVPAASVAEEVEAHTWPLTNRESACELTQYFRANLGMVGSGPVLFRQFPSPLKPTEGPTVCETTSLCEKMACSCRSSLPLG